MKKMSCYKFCLTFLVQKYKDGSITLFEMLYSESNVLASM